MSRIQAEILASAFPLTPCLGFSLLPECKTSIPDINNSDEMDVVKAIETYVNKMVSTPNAIKVLLLDTHTASIR